MTILKSARSFLCAAAIGSSLAMASTAVSIGTAEAASNPGFNCRTARNRTEHAICSSRWLARLDRRLNYWYRRAMLRARYFDVTRQVRREQRAWLRRRNRCYGKRRCIARMYYLRIHELRNWATHV